MMLPPGRPFMPVGQPGGLPMMPGRGLAPAPGLPMGGNNLAPMPSTGMPMPSTMPRPMGLAPPMGGTTLPPPTGPMMPMMDASMPRPMGPSVVIPPPAPQGMRPQMIPAPQPFPAMPPRPPPGSLPQQLAQLQAAGQEAHRQAPPPPVPFQGEKKPQLFMLIAQLSPHVQESHMQQLLEQCGDLQAFRRAQDAEGKPMSFGVAQFADPESAWKAVTCLSKQRIGGQEIKVLLEENTEHFILKWKTSQKAVFRVSSDEDLEWELERKAVSCKALVDGKLEELFGAEGTGAAQQRRQELRAREDKRVERARKRKAWREAEYSEELERCWADVLDCFGGASRFVKGPPREACGLRVLGGCPLLVLLVRCVEVSELGLREAERKRDEEDREKEEQELQEKQRKEQKLEKLEAQHGVVRSADVAQLAENRALMELVHKVQEEPREELFTMKLDTAYLRNERILERKLRPWLERKIEALDLHMGGQASDLVELIIRRVNGAAQPDPLIAELERFLDEFAEPLVERLWRMLALELD
ncbi:RNA-binding protein 25 (Arg/Glu/Asp-rich protein of 120 kDa) (RED120) (Protein S164) (RNA-binding motif protein 25) (RNA-binding region-containing protein 7) [Durusdinium trenchii]|uniref:RNA-binding protein 25 (Arg/Glu/Asp-rich protein of 120 kDa) (RED120) (Protein S164) (RNA-binding motif protein 25) (RNA-binding region-containing protein 7) n=1 Tax=Durusdinium trenchii TaxID=1381693 RepID=A0ABP0L1W5_9DINO